LSRRDIGWARLGIGRVKVALGEYDEAVEDLSALIDQNGNLIEAYDVLADAYLKKGSGKLAQRTLQKAVDISPHAIIRQKKLASVCSNNKDYDGAASAFRKTMKLGFNSVHESADNYLNLGRSLSDLAEGDKTELGKKRAKEAVHTMERVGKKFKDDKNVRMSAALIESRVHKGQGDDAKSKTALLKAEKVMSVEDADAYTILDFAKTLYATGEGDKAEVLLSELAEKNADNSDIIAKIEELLDEPVSLQDKSKARQLNKQGIGAFEKGDLDEAVKVFEEALLVTPKHPSLNLNMIQVMLKQISQQKGNPELKRKCMSCLDNVKHIPTQHRQYKRFAHLQKKVGAL